jgi:hypothetical protein
VIVGHDPLEGMPGSEGKAGFADVEKLGKLDNAGLPDPAPGTFERDAKIFGKNLGLYDGTPDAARNQQIAFSGIQPEFWCLAWLSRPDLFRDVMVQIINSY